MQRVSYSKKLGLANRQITLERICLLKRLLHSFKETAALSK